jgi:hypothetical protein
MLAAPFVGLSLVLTVAVAPVPNADSVPHLSLQQKTAAIQPLIRSATECIARRVAADPRFKAQDGDLNELIVDSVPSCVDAVRAMIAAHDRYFGDGTGEAFFSGAYLDILPTAVSRWIGRIEE